MHASSDFVIANKAHEKFVQSKGTLLIDVRNKTEFDDGYAPGAINIPLDRLELDELKSRQPGWLPEIQPVYLVCETGYRSSQAADRLRQQGLQNLAVVDGGMRAWREAKLPVKRHSRLPSLERQTQIAIGVVLLLILFKGVFVHTAFFSLVGAVAVGLVVTGITASCSLTALLARMPWNQRQGNAA